MPQPRKYPTNAARQAAYRARKERRKAAEAAGPGRVVLPNQSIVARVMAADAKAT